MPFGYQNTLVFPGVLKNKKTGLLRDNSRYRLSLEYRMMHDHDLDKHLSFLIFKKMGNFDQNNCILIERKRRIKDKILYSI